MHAIRDQNLPLSLNFDIFLGTHISTYYYYYLIAERVLQ